MSYSVRLQFYDGKTSKPRQLPVPWWDKDELMRTLRFNSVYDEGYFEYFCEVDKEQLKQIFNEQLPHIEEGIYQDTRKRDIVLPYAEKVEDILCSDCKFKSIKVDIYEFD